MRFADDRCQGGYALLVMMLVLIGVGGLVASDFSRDVRARAEHERFLHNQRVLKEAKRALLMYAYNYPDIAVPAGRRGPGRLPCPDADNDGVPEVLADCSNAGPVPLVGRFPWAANGMNLYDLRDADGQRLWYAVSANFDFADDDLINAGTDGTITIHDQNDNLLYGEIDDRVAAVIIVAGPPIERAGVGQDRSIANTDDPDDAVADTDPGIVNPTNYLDLFPGRDNADFDNAAGSTDGFILGPIYDASGDVIVNDQFILITADEVTRVAQRRALDDYRTAIAAWQETVWANPADRRYPWLNDYDDIVAPDLDIYEVDPAGDSAGRVPVLNYFEDHDSHRVIMDLLIDYNLAFNLTDIGPDGGGYVDAFDSTISGPRQLDIRNAYVSVTQLEPGGANNRTDDRITLRSDASLGAVATNLVTPPIPPQRLYFWDGCAGGSCGPPQTTWQLCAPPATSETDCAMQDAPPYNFNAWTGDWANHADIRIRFVELRYDIDAEFEIGLNLSPPLTFNPNPPADPVPPGAGTNARRVYGIDGLISGAYLNRAIDEDEVAGEDADFIEIAVVRCEQDNFVGDNYNVPSSNPDGNSYDCSGDITLDDTPVLTQFDITVDYYPELPVWVSQNLWNDTILFAYAPDFAPTGDGNCLAPPTCLTVDHDFDGGSTTVFSLLVGANDHPGTVVPNPPLDPGLIGIFEGPNDVPGEEGAGGSPDAAYDANPTGGDDTLLIVNGN